jgi:hypothetical protein
MAVSGRQPSSSIRRPSSLAEAALWARQDGEFDAHLRDFLHEYKLRPDFQMLREEPATLRERFDDAGLRDAYLAAAAALLARQIRREVPPWALGDARFLARPWFAAADTARLRLRLLQESPPEFRERNLFISENGIDVY